MDTHICVNTHKRKWEVGKCGKQNGDNSRRNADKVEKSHQMEATPWKYDDNYQPKIQEKALPTCQVILTRCDGFTSPGPSYGTFNAERRNSPRSGDTSGRTNFARCDKLASGQTNSEVSNSRGIPTKPINLLDSPVSTQREMKQHVCQLCSKSFGQLGSLQLHIRAHTGDRPHKCQLCSKTFGRIDHLNTHIQSHTGERPHQCQFCSKSFVNSSNLNVHIRRHTGERHYQCQVCSKSFSQQGTLQLHIQSHTGERPYQCQLCSKSFSRRSILNEHIRTHTGERFHHCKFCAKTFGQAENLKRHIRRIHTPHE